MRRLVSSLLVVGIALLGLVALAACGDDDDEAINDATPTDNEGSDVQELTVEMMDTLAFEPARLEVKAGSPVHLSVSNANSAALHDFTVASIHASHVATEGGSSDSEHMDDHGDGEPMDGDEHMDDADGTDMMLHLALDGGADGEIVFTPTEPGEFEFVCTVPGHADAGMVGTLVVTEG